MESNMSRHSLLLAWTCVLLSAVIWVAACSDHSSLSGDGDVSDGDVIDGDALDGDVTDGDAPDGDASDGDLDATDGDGEEEETISFAYSACADPSAVLQFPTPAWEQPSTAAFSGVQLVIPANDKAAELFNAEREEWLAQIPDMDGFPLMAGWLVALDDVATSIDVSKIEIWLATDATTTRFEAFLPETAILDDGRTLWIATKRALPIPSAPTRAILAIYEGAISGAAPLPACAQTTTEANPAYVTAAIDVIRTNGRDDLQLAAPATVSHQARLLPGIDSALANAPETALAVESIDSQTMADFVTEEYPPSDEVIAAADDTVLVGILATPDFQDENGIFVVAHEAALPVSQGETEPGFVLIRPKVENTPYPVVLFQHGGGRTPKDLLNVAGPYVEAGFAVIGIDLPYHGNRKIETGTAFGNMADFSSPLRTRDNFRQAAADHLAVERGLDLINQALQDTGLGSNLDTTRVFFIGHSMGSISGSLGVASSSLLAGSSLIAGGAPFRQLVKEGLFQIAMLDILDENRPQVESTAMLALLQTMLDAGDPAIYGCNAEDKTKAPKAVLLWEIIDDPIANNTATDWQALAFGATLALPALHDAPDLPQAELPLTGTLSWTGNATTGTRALIQFARPELGVSDKHMGAFLEPMVHAATATCFASLAAGAACTLDVQAEEQ
jgi:pimeloyl-ACP methyl ester carboxylesterase